MKRYKLLSCALALLLLLSLLSCGEGRVSTEGALSILPSETPPAYSEAGLAEGERLLFLAIADASREAFGRVVREGAIREGIACLLRDFAERGIPEHEMLSLVRTLSEGSFFTTLLHAMRGKGEGVLSLLPLFGELSRSVGIHRMTGLLYDLAEISLSLAVLEYSTLYEKNPTHTYLLREIALFEGYGEQLAHIGEENFSRALRTAVAASAVLSLGGGDVPGYLASLSSAELLLFLGTEGELLLSLSLCREDVLFLLSLCERVFGGHLLSAIFAAGDEGAAAEALLSLLPLLGSALSEMGEAEASAILARDPSRALHGVLGAMSEGERDAFFDALTFPTSPDRYRAYLLRTGLLGEYNAFCEGSIPVSRADVLAAEPEALIDTLFDYIRYEAPILAYLIGV